MNEAERQQRLLERLLATQPDAGALSLRESGARALHGLGAYRTNAEAGAARALAAAFPTVQQLVGAQDFAILARDHWRAEPPRRGDLGEWGEAFPAALQADARLADWPYLADCARLDWALHRCERAADAALDTRSIERLGDTDPARLVIEFMPGVAVVVSPWPVAQIRAAHHSDEPDAFDAVSASIAAHRGEAVVVSRRGYKAVPHSVDPALAHWMQRLMAGQDLAAALEQAPAGFDLGTWLADALEHAWVKGIRVQAD